MQLFTLILFAAFISAECGNGVLDDGEQCDFAIQNQTECCDQKCKRLSDYRSQCGGGQGICIGGVCKTRQQQCSLFDSKIFAITSNSYTGPFTSCNINGSQATQRCTLACQGKSVSGNNAMCIDFGAYSNFNSIVQDGLVCGGLDQGSTLGVCLNGQCADTSCRNTLCNTRGSCYRATQSGPVSCKCDDGFYGAFCGQSVSGCQGGTIDYCGVCNGKNDTCTFDMSRSNIPISTPATFSKSSTFMTIVLPIVISVCIIIIVLGLYLAYRKFRKVRQISARKLSRSNSQSSASRVKGLFRKPSTTSANQIGISVKFDEYRVSIAYVKSMPDELNLQVGDIVYKFQEFDDGWSTGYNTRTQEEGAYPTSFCQRVDLLQ